MKSHIITFLVIFVLGLVLSACSRPPTEEIKRAQDAVILAESDPIAVTYAGNTLIRAREALFKMQSEADSKRYDTAKNFAAEAINLAERAITEGRTGLNRAMEEASNLIGGLSGLINETLNALNAARDMQLDVESLYRDLDLAKQAYDQAMQDFQAGNYREAMDKGQTVRVLLSDINMRISQAAQVVSRKQ